MGVTKLEHIRKKKKFQKLIVNAGILFLVTIIIVVLYGLRSDISQLDIFDNIHYFFAGTTKGQGFPIALPDSNVKIIYEFDKDVAVKGKSNIYIYNKNGGLKSTISHRMQNAILKINQNRALIYDRGSNTLAIHSKSKEIFKKDYENTIISSDIAGNSSFAVAMSAQYYASQVLVYSNAYEEVFRWASADKTANNISLSDDGKKIVISSLGIIEGELESTISIYSVTSDREIATIKLPNQIVLDMKYHKNKTVSVVTDTQTFLLTERGQIVNSYAFQGQKLSKFDLSDYKNMVIVLENITNNQTSKIISMNDRMQIRAEKEVPYIVKSLYTHQDSSYVLDRENLYIYSAALQDIKTQPMPQVYDFCVINDALYATTGTSIEYKKIS
ncbi:MAG: DUF5711 family protein [Oscillospiraceae bacterium]